jgi:hypothetical protein
MRIDVSDNHYIIRLKVSLRKSQIKKNKNTFRIHVKSSKSRYVDGIPTLAKMQISQSVITTFEGRSILHRCLQYMQKSEAQDIWFLLLISAIKAHLRLVRDIATFW